MKNWYFEKNGKPRTVSREYPLPWREYSTAEKVKVILQWFVFIIVVVLLTYL